MLKFKEEDQVLYEDDRVALELGNYSAGATIYVLVKTPDGVIDRRYPLSELLEEDDRG